jgi:DNA-binding MarR family transcriptional regulator
MHLANGGSPYRVDMTRDYWTFLTNHGHVLVCLASDPDVVLRDVATHVGITERAVQQIVRDLELAGVIARVRVGRRNRYVICSERGFRHTLEADVTLGAFLDLVAEDGARPDCPATVPATAGSCPIATGFGCPLAEEERVELDRRSTVAPHRQPAP